MIVKINRQYVVDGFVSEMHECDMFRFIDPSKKSKDVGSPDSGEVKVYSAVFFKGENQTEFKFMPGDTIYVMEKGKTVDTFFIPNPPQECCSPK
jgi:hypothetical protein